MILNLLSFFVGFLLLIMTAIILLRHKQDKHLNVFFLLLLIIVGIQRFVFGLSAFGIIDFTFNPFSHNRLFALLIPPIYFLFFYSLLYVRASIKRIVMHLIIPLIVIAIFSLFTFDAFIAALVFFAYSSTYIILLIILFKSYFKLKKNSKQLGHFKRIKSMSILMFSMFFIIYIFLNYIHILRFKIEDFNFIEQFYSLTSIIWFVILFYILKNPVIIYGEQQLTEEINQTEKVDFEVWRKSKKRQTEKADLDLEKKMKGNIDKIIFSIKSFETELLLDLKKLPSLKELAYSLDYSQSHLKYVFKYYSHYTYGDYQNALKIRYAIKLIKSGFLDVHTIDSLAIKCIYTNRSTFFKNFKKFTGYSAREYAVACTGKS